MRLVVLMLVAWACFAQVHVNVCGVGDAGFTGGTCYTSPLPLPGGAAAYFQNTRYGTNFSYQFPVSDGNYNLTLHFIENSASGSTPTITAAGQRVFSVTANGNVVLPSLDLFAVAGSNVPVDRTFQVVASGGTGIRLVFAFSVRNAVVSGIDLAPMQPAPSNPFPGCAAYKGGIKCQGGFTSGDGRTYAAVLVWGGTTYVLPNGDGTGKSFHDNGTVDCASANVDPDIIALGLPCHLFIWQ